MDTITSNMQLAILILPGRNGNSPIYAATKKVCLEERPVPSQIVLSGTLSRGKNIASIMSGILIQINAKIGGTPWVIRDIPLSNVPTMLISLETVKKGD